MAKKGNPWIPSGGVLAVAVIAAVVAAVLLNVYIQAIKSPYEETKTYLVADQEIAEGEVIEEGHLGVLEVPLPLLENDAFERFVPVNDKTVVLRKKARWDIPRGNLIAYRDIGLDTTEPLLMSLRDDFELVRVDIEPNEMLQPGMFVNLRGTFDPNPEDKKDEFVSLDVLYGVQVKAVGGSTSVAEDRRRNDDSIQIAVPSAVAKKLIVIDKRLTEKRFKVGIISPDSDQVRAEPTLAPDILDLLQPAGKAAPIIP